ncbi:MAG: 2-keto-3-deoxygluconate kinase, partial [Pseudonocardiales bacterium]
MVSYDVLVLGEVLVELSTSGPLRSGAELRLGFSGDALNVAAAAAAAGARTGLLARMADDELSDELCDRVAQLGVDTALLRRVSGEHGVYFVTADPDGSREFVYVRRGSAGSTLQPADLTGIDVAGAGAVVASGITCAVSDSAWATVQAAAQQASRFIYDPNLRRRLTTVDEARAMLGELAPFAALVTPAAPGETRLLLGTDDPGVAAAACRQLGAAAAMVTCGSDGVVLDSGAAPRRVPAVPPERLVDQTGAGDNFVGTVAARLVAGDPLELAAALGCAAASLSLSGQGGTGRVPTLAQTRAKLAATDPDAQA